MIEKLFYKILDLDKIVDTMVYFSEKSRREGLLSLEDELENINNDIFKFSLQLVVDGTDPQVIIDILNSATAKIVTNVNFNWKIWKDILVTKDNRNKEDTITYINNVFAIDNQDNKTCKEAFIELSENLYKDNYEYFEGHALTKANIKLLNSCRKDSVLANQIAEVLNFQYKQYSIQMDKFLKIIVDGISAIQSGNNPYIVEEKMLAIK